MFVRLTCALTNRPLYLNPEHVVAVCPWRDPGGETEYTAVSMTDDAGAAPGQSVRRVLEPIDEVVARLSSGQYDIALAPAAPAPVSVVDGDSLTAAERLAVAEAIHAERLASLSSSYDFSLLMELYGIGDAVLERLPDSVLAKATKDCERIATTHPDAGTREGYANRAARYRELVAARRGGP